MPFNTTKRLLNDLEDQQLEISITSSTRTTRGDITTVANAENIGDTEKERYDTTQTTIQIVNNAGEVYAEAIAHNLKQNPEIALIDWVEVVDMKNRGHGVGRALHEDIVNYLTNNTPAKRIYTKLENPSMQGPIIDTGFKQITTPTNETWYRRD